MNFSSPVGSEDINKFIIFVNIFCVSICKFVMKKIIFLLNLLNTADVTSSLLYSESLETNNKLTLQAFIESHNRFSKNCSNKGCA